MNLKRIQALISGKVQGVGFRAATLSEARRQKLTGCVRNTSDGDVETVAEGTSESVDSFLDWCRRGPASARVDAVTVSENGAVPRAEFAAFEIRR